MMTFKVGGKTVHLDTESRAILVSEPLLHPEVGQVLDIVDRLIKSGFTIAVEQPPADEPPTAQQQESLTEGSMRFEDIPRKGWFYDHDAYYCKIDNTDAWVYDRDGTPRGIVSIGRNIISRFRGSNPVRAFRNPHRIPEAVISGKRFHEIAGHNWFTDGDVVYLKINDEDRRVLKYNLEGMLRCVGIYQGTDASLVVLGTSAERAWNYVREVLSDK